MSTENEMTIPEMDELTAEELAAADPTGLATLLYVIRGLGADRDRSMNLAEFVAFIQKLITTIYIEKHTGTDVKIDGEGMRGFTGGSEYNFNGQNISISNSIWEFLVKNGTFKYGFVYQDKEYNLTMDHDSLRLTQTVDETETTTVFELKLNGHIDELNYDKLGGIIDMSRVANPKIYENEQVVAKQNVEGASFKFHVQGGTKLYFDRNVPGKYLTILDGTTHAVVEFVNVVFNRGGVTERIELVPCFNATVGSDT